MEYISIHEVSKKWHMKERKITGLCRDKRIAGARKVGKTWLIPSDALKPLDKRTKEFEETTKKEGNLTISYTSNNGEEKVVNTFKKKYKKEPMYTTFTPYRICPLGAHVDYNLGITTGFAIDKGIHIAYSLKTNGVIELESLQFPKRAQWHVLAAPNKKQNDWADYLRGATIALQKRFPLRYGMAAVIDGELPIGGLSSSASLIITFINALAFLNNVKLTNNDLIEIAKEAENDYVGDSNGVFNQYCEIYAEKNKLLYMDMKTETYELIDTPSNMKPYIIGIFFSGLEKSLDPKKYNMRIDELRAAAYYLKAISGMEYGKFTETNMRDVPYQTYEKYKDNLPSNFSKRASHFYSEIKRVKLGIELYRKGDIEKFGKLVTESGQSTITNWETVAPEMIKLYEILKETKGVYGTRFSGAGFKGCCLALIDPKYSNEIFKSVEEKYLNIYPNLKGKYSAHICHSADGIKI